MWSIALKETVFIRLLTRRGSARNGALSRIGRVHVFFLTKNISYKSGVDKLWWTRPTIEVKWTNNGVDVVNSSISYHELVFFK